MMYNIILTHNSKFKIKQNKIENKIKKLSPLFSTLIYEAELKESLLVLIEIKFNLNYNSEEKTSTNFTLSLYCQDCRKWT